ncbi:hypothetical protein Taro_006843 [Colocasia esculenta]|uniref:Uncharacterized protein n=1 Tax=Colocasia esculenta TaxID=4460 RepID=A0A843TYS8_COLES|nr:hypothetical protein [Colocasia esculenta]
MKMRHSDGAKNVDVISLSGLGRWASTGKRGKTVVGADESPQNPKLIRGTRLKNRGEPFNA